MDGLTSTEQEKLEWERKAALEAEVITNHKKQEQLNEEIVQLRLRKRKLQQEEEELQGRLSAEFEAEARAKVIYQASQSQAEKNTPEKEDQGLLMKNLYKNLTFDITDPLQGIAGELFNVPDKPATIPKPRYSVTRKAEVLNFNDTNLRSLHLHREVDRKSDGHIMGHASSSGTSGECESSDGETIPFEEFARIPPNMVPVLKDGVLAFRAGRLVS